MPMYHLIEYSKNYSKTTGSFGNYYKDEPNSGANNNINYSIKDSKSFDYKTSITGKLEGNNTGKKVKIVAPLKHLRNFQRTLDMSLINCEINLILTLFKMGEGAKSPPTPTSFSPATSTIVRISPQKFLNFSFNPFDRLV